jgi:hypothetical protein
MNKERRKLVICRDTLRRLDSTVLRGIRGAGTLTMEGGCNSVETCGGGGGGGTSTVECTQLLGPT